VRSFHYLGPKAVIAMHIRILPLTLICALSLVALGARTYAAEEATAAERTAQVPEPAAAVGFNTLTFGPAVKVGSNWQKFDFFGTNPSTVNVTQNADGSVTINGGGNDYGGQLSTASVGTGTRKFSGIAFGGGGYFQATMSFDGPAAFWANDIENMNGVSVGSGPNQWPGQAKGYGNWIETDIAEFDTRGVYGISLHNWYGIVGSGARTSTVGSGSPVSPAGANYTVPNTYGFLWMPATASTQGYAKFYFNGEQVGNTITWNQYNPALPPPPVDQGTGGSSAYSILDKLHLALILGGSSSTPNTVYNVQVWQASAADDISTLPTPTHAHTHNPDGAAEIEPCLQCRGAGPGRNAGQ
jgi:hypothetical protein